MKSGRMRLDPCNLAKVRPMVAAFWLDIDLTPNQGSVC
jgi:hypothetical protein